MTTIEAELTTPTGAAILTTLADFNAPETMEPKLIGYGAGSRNLQELPNLLRLIIGETESQFEHDLVNPDEKKPARSASYGTV
jgi:uncharacterized protein (DUF111 family)